MAPFRSSAGPLIVSYVVMVVLSIVVVALRFMSIRILQRRVKVHDILCVISLVSLIAYAIDTMIGTIDGGIGEHIYKLSLPELTIALKTFFASQFFWATSISAFRLSILLLYIEIFPKPLFHRFAYGSVGFVGLFYVGSMMTTLTLCRPINFSWNKTIPGTCGDLAKAEMAAAAINMVLDVVIVLLPLPVVWGLQMSKQKKIGITATFALGLSIAGINLGRIVKVLDCDLADFTYCTRDSAILTVAEMAVGVIVACIPTLGPIVFPHRRHGASARNPYADKNGNTSGSGAHIRLRGYRNDSFNDGSLQRLERDEINETHSLDYGEAKAHTFIHADTSKSADPTYGSSNNIEVRSVIEITKNLQSK